MPMYDYVCLECHHQFERIRSSRDADAVQECPACKAERVRRRLSVVAAFVNAENSAVAAQPQRAGGCCGGSCGCGSGNRLN